MLTQRWVFRAIPDAVADARRVTRDVAERLGVDPSLLSSVVLCVSEAVTNAVAHAYRHEREPGSVEVELRRPAGGLRLFVRDHGAGIAPRPDSPGAGLGLVLVARLANRIVLRRVAPRGTELEMSFDVEEGGRGAATADQPARAHEPAAG
jgi:anti-sigma regulatory factor (Ser/Thr protein kinase)